MSAYVYRFDRILSLREMEKNETEMAYQAAIDRFEKVATALYDQLKQKEETIEAQRSALEKGASVLSIHGYIHFIERLEKRIAQLQQDVIQARRSMQIYEQQLVERVMEVKKYEKMRAQDLGRFQKAQAQMEVKQLDELSMTAVYGKDIR